MRKYFKTGILIVLLIVPVLVFLFLKGFGSNHYTLKTFYPVDFDTVVVEGKKRIDTVYHKIPSFSLTSQSGEVVSDETFDNGIYVADFFFTKCPDVCPKMSSQLARVQDSFEKDANVKILSYSIDPEFDSAEVLSDYAAMYGAKEGKWYFATGSKKEIYDLARNGYFVSATVGSGGEGDFLHSEKFVLVDKNKHIRGYYNGTDPEEVDRLILEIRILLYEEEMNRKKELAVSN